MCRSVRSHAFGLVTQVRARGISHLFDPLIMLRLYLDARCIGQCITALFRLFALTHFKLGCVIRDILGARANPSLQTSVTSVPLSSIRRPDQIFSIFGSGMRMVSPIYSSYLDYPLNIFARVLWHAGYHRYLDQCSMRCIVSISCSCSSMLVRDIPDTHTHPAGRFRRHLPYFCCTMSCVHPRYSGYAPTYDAAGAHFGICSARCILCIPSISASSCEDSAMTILCLLE